MRSDASVSVLAAAIVAAMAFSTAGLFGCHDAATTTTRDEIIVARVGDLEITANEMDARILSLPAQDRPKPGDDLDAWLIDQARELAVERRLLAAAEASHVADSDQFTSAAREAERTLAVELCLETLRPVAPPITEDELRAAYDAHREIFAAPERRAAYHLFLRFQIDVPHEETFSRIEGLRDRVLNGESFTRLAAANSDSESRHRDGSIGWVIPGRLPAEFEKVIFALDEGVPSEPVATPEGYHLFYVDQALPPRQSSFEEARPALLQRLTGERAESTVTRILAEVEPPPDSLMLDRSGLASVAEAGDPETVVLRIGDTVLTLEDLRHQVRRLVGQQPATSRQPLPADLAWRVLEANRRRELLYRYCQSHDGIPATDLETRLGDWRRSNLVNLERHRRLVEVAKSDDARLRLYYESNIGQFSSPPKWHLRRLRLPLDQESSVVMARLEAAAAEDGIGLEGLRDELGGEIDDLGFKNLAELKRLEPKLPALVAPLDPGHLSAPYRTDDALEIVSAVERQDSEAIPYSDVQDRVAAAFVEQYSAEVYQALTEEVLTSGQFEIVPEGIAHLRNAGLAPENVSVDDLENLLNELQ